MINYTITIRGRVIKTNSRELLKELKPMTISQVNKHLNTLKTIGFINSITKEKV